ncbi:hypothetical protein K0M31_016911 [Melipona bicolor]|uniref:Uncharacterized protein n=1 Tax=Melipona bicolor TaxID=60889 RepID=A0AA40FE00_9HYME|nr:hypothetical protein K0M31_016911 [Melipona bicolor]
MSQKGQDGSATCENDMSMSKNNSLLRLNQESRRASGDWQDQETDSEISETDFLTKGAFLLTPSHELSIEKAATICEKMNFRGAFSLTKTATGILFKFSNIDDFQAVYKKGFHKVTGARFYKKVAIPCRPAKTFTVYVLDVPEELPEEDIRHALYKYRSIVEVTRLPLNTGTVCEYSSPTSLSIDKTGQNRETKGRKIGKGRKRNGAQRRNSTGRKHDVKIAGLMQLVTLIPGIRLERLPIELISPTACPLTRCLLCELVKAINDKLKSDAHTQNEPATIYTGPPVIRVTLASVEETSTLLSRGLDFYGATYFPTETPHPAAQPLAKYKNNRWETDVHACICLAIFVCTLSPRQPIQINFNLSGAPDFHHLAPALA